jgi:4'-phosphopantetheinyl transferase
VDSGNKQKPLSAEAHPSGEDRTSLSLSPSTLEERRWRKRREILAFYARCHPEALLIERTSCGKPYIRETRHIHFNAADSGLVSALAVASRPVGVDLEALEDLSPEDVEDAADFVLSEQEMVSLRDLPRKDWRPFYLRAWTRREAYLKATGEGLSHANLPDVVVPPDGKVYATGSVPCRRWQVWEREPIAGYFLAVVVERPTRILVLNLM